MTVGFDTEAFKPVFKGYCERLTCKAGYYNASDIKPYSAESVNKPERFKVVGYAEVASALVFLNSVGVDNDNYSASSLSSKSILTFESGAKPGSTREA